MRLMRQLHDYAARIYKLDAIADPRESHWSALLYLHGDSVWQKPHYDSGFNPGNILELLPAQFERNEKNIPPNVGAQHFHDLRARVLVQPAHPDVVARL